jgi:hypothetical protein
VGCGIPAYVGVLALSLFRLRTANMKKKVPLLGAVTALMLVAMSLEILPIAYHLNMSVAFESNA